MKNGEVKHYQNLGPRHAWCILRYPRDYEGGRLRGFTQKQLDGDSNLFGTAVPAGNRWHIHTFLFAPFNPLWFDAFRKFAEEFPSATLEFKIPNQEALTKIPITYFWSMGEYTHTPKFTLKWPFWLPETVSFRLDIEIPEKTVLEIPREFALREIFAGPVAFRLGFLYELEGAP